MSIPDTPCVTFRLVRPRRCCVSPEDDEHVLGYLGELGLRPGERVNVVDAAPFEGPLTVEVKGKTTAIAREIARS